LEQVDEGNDVVNRNEIVKCSEVEGVVEWVKSWCMLNREVMRGSRKIPLRESGAHSKIIDTE